MTHFFFDSWISILRIVIISTLAYTTLIILLRISGKRTLSKMNAFDLIVTVALGSTFATAILSKDVPLVDGVMAFTMLILLQYIITYLSVKSKKFSEMIKSQPVLLVYKGNYISENMNRERVVESEVIAAIRESGAGSVSDVTAVVLETNGEMTVVTTSPIDANLLPGKRTSNS